MRRNIQILCASAFLCADIAATHAGDVYNIDQLIIQQNQGVVGDDNTNTYNNQVDTPFIAPPAYQALGQAPRRNFPETREGGSRAVLPPFRYENEQPGLQPNPYPWPQTYSGLMDRHNNEDAEKVLEALGSTSRRNPALLPLYRDMVEQYRNQSTGYD
jgi:hypothetical protein